MFMSWILVSTEKYTNKAQIDDDYDDDNDGWRLPCGAEWAQKDITIKLVATYFAKVQNWRRC